MTFGSSVIALYPGLGVSLSSDESFDFDSGSDVAFDVSNMVIFSNCLEHDGQDIMFDDFKFKVAYKMGDSETTCMVQFDSRTDVFQHGRFRTIIHVCYAMEFYFP